MLYTLGFCKLIHCVTKKWLLLGKFQHISIVGKYILQAQYIIIYEIANILHYFTLKFQAQCEHFIDSIIIKIGVLSD